MSIFSDIDYVMEDKDILDIIDKTAENVVKLLLLRGIKVSFAESCTGGLLSSLTTDVAGASACYEYGVCTYSDRIKNKILGVPRFEIDANTAVSAEVALSMVKGLRSFSGAEICVSITGIAGPSGGTEEKPVGTVYMGLYVGNNYEAKLLDKLYLLKDKSRKSIKYHTALAVFSQLEVILQNERTLQESGIIKSGKTII